MKHIINEHIVLYKPPVGPLAGYPSPFAESVTDRGYSHYTINRQVSLAACFSEWLEQSHIELASVNSSHPERYSRYRSRTFRSRSDDAAALGHLMDFLRSEGCLSHNWTKIYSKHSETPLYALQFAQFQHSSPICQPIPQLRVKIEPQPLRIDAYLSAP